MEHRGYVGPHEKYDIIGAQQFNIVTSFGLREHHKLLDIGCGSLRGGRLFIVYLNKQNYFGIEPNKWLIEDGIKHEIGNELIEIKTPSFEYNSDFNLQIFNEKFDFIMAQSIFSHASENHIRICCKNIYEVMHENSIFFATYLKGNENYSGEEWVYPQGVRYIPTYIHSIIESCNLKCEELTSWIHPNGQTWLKITK